MLAIRNGLKSIWRNWKKAGLFLTLLFILELLLSQGLSVYGAARDYLDQCSEFYRSIAVLEYLGSQYPEECVYDADLAHEMDALDLNALQNLQGVTSYRPAKQAVAQIGDLRRTDSWVYRPNQATILVSNVFWSENANCYQGTIEECLYAKKDYNRTTVFITTQNLEDFEPLPNSWYAFTGEFIVGETSNLWFTAESYTLPDGTEVPAWFAFPAKELPKDSVYRTVGQIMSYSSNGVVVRAADDLENYYPFQQAQLYIESGRSYTAGEAGVCVITPDLAAKLHVTLGDMIPLSFAFAENMSMYQAIFAQNGVANEAKNYEVVGITNANTSYTYQIFVPIEAEHPYAAMPTGYTLGQFSLESDKAEAFMTHAQEMLPEGFRLTLYDQGYATAADPYTEIVQISLVFLGICVLLSAAVLVLFGYLFVYRQKDTAGTLWALGAGTPHILTYFVAGSGSIALLGAGLGMILGAQVQTQIVGSVLKLTSQLQTADLRFSDRGLKMQKLLDYVPSASSKWSVLSAALLVAGGIVSCLFFAAFLARNRRAGKKRKKNRAPKHLGKSSTLKGGYFKYPLLSIRRGGMRTAAVLLVGALAAIFLGQLTATKDVYRDQLKELNATTKIRGYFTDQQAKRVEYVGVNYLTAQNIYDSPYTENLRVSMWKGEAMFVGVSKRDGQDLELEDYPVPSRDSTFAFESFEAIVAKQPGIIGTQDINITQEFFFTDGAEVEYLSGYDPEDMRVDSNALVSTAMMKNKDVRLGDTIRMVSSSGYHYELLVIGSYVSRTGSELIYCGTGEIPVTEKFSGMEYTFLSGAAFEVSDPTKLSEFKDELESMNIGQSDSYGLRTFVVLEDEDYYEAVNRLNRQIQYSDLLYRCLYVLCGLVGLAVAFLTVHARKPEAAIMRGLGAQRTRIFASFFAEQFLLCFVGCGAGLGIWALIGKPMLPLLWILIAAFWGCWLLGSALATIAMLQSPALAALSDRE